MEFLYKLYEYLPRMTSFDLQLVENIPRLLTNVSKELIDSNQYSMHVFRIIMEVFTQTNDKKCMNILFDYFIQLLNSSNESYDILLSELQLLGNTLFTISRHIKDIITINEVEILMRSTSFHLPFQDISGIEPMKQRIELMNSNKFANMCNFWFLCSYELITQNNTFLLSNSINLVFSLLDWLLIVDMSGDLTFAYSIVLVIESYLYGLKKHSISLSISTLMTLEKTLFEWLEKIVKLQLSSEDMNDMILKVLYESILCLSSIIRMLPRDRMSLSSFRNLQKLLSYSSFCNANQQYIIKCVDEMFQLLVIVNSKEYSSASESINTFLSCSSYVVFDSLYDINIYWINNNLHILEMMQTYLRMDWSLIESPLNRNSLESSAVKRLRLTFQGTPHKSPAKSNKLQYKESNIIANDNLAKRFQTLSEELSRWDIEVNWSNDCNQNVLFSKFVQCSFLLRVYLSIAKLPPFESIDWSSIIPKNQSSKKRSRRGSNPLSQDSSKHLFVLFVEILDVLIKRDCHHDQMRFELIIHCLQQILQLIKSSSLYLSQIIRRVCQLNQVCVNLFVKNPKFVGSDIVKDSLTINCLSTKLTSCYVASINTSILVPQQKVIDIASKILCDVELYSSDKVAIKSMITGYVATLSSPWKLQFLHTMYVDMNNKHLMDNDENIEHFLELLRLISLIWISIDIAISSQLALEVMTLVSSLMTNLSQKMFKNFDWLFHTNEDSLSFLSSYVSPRAPMLVILMKQKLYEAHVASEEMPSNDPIIINEPIKRLVDSLFHYFETSIRKSFTNNSDNSNVELSLIIQFLLKLRSCISLTTLHISKDSCKHFQDMKTSIDEFILHPLLETLNIHQMRELASLHQLIASILLEGVEYSCAKDILLMLRTINFNGDNLIYTALVQGVNYGMTCISILKPSTSYSILASILETLANVSTIQDVYKMTILCNTLESLCQHGVIVAIMSYDLESFVEKVILKSCLWNIEEESTIAIKDPMVQVMLMFIEMFNSKSYSISTEVLRIDKLFEDILLTSILYRDDISSKLTMF